MRGSILVAAVLVLVAALGLLAVDRRWFVLGASRAGAPAGSDREPGIVTVDLAPAADWDRLPRYVDLVIGDTVRVVKPGGDVLDIRVAGVEIEDRNYAHPRTRVDLEAGGRSYPARCGMNDRSRGGIGPIEIDGVKIGVEVTRLLYSTARRGRSNYNAYRHFRLRGDLRLAIWDAGESILRGTAGRFILDQAEWQRDRLGNWLHTTNYGLHGATDLYATDPDAPDPVLSPVDGVVHGVYFKDADVDDRRHSKTVLIYGDAAVGPNGQKVLYRLMHLSELFVSRNQKVKAGEVIGLSGHTGFDPAIGDHVHFEMRLDPSLFGEKPLKGFIGTVPINPYPFLLEWRDRTPHHRPKAGPGE